MCSQQEWESYARRFQEAVDEGQLREFVANAAARIEAFVDELKTACGREDAYWGCGRRRRSGADQVRVV